MTALPATAAATATSTWLPAGCSRAVGRRPVATTVSGVELVLFREGSGAVRALEDRCCHRRVPLSLGRITDAGVLQCGYHGWCFDGTGSCVAIPQLQPGEPVPSRFGVQAFPAAEAAGIIWVRLDRSASPTPLPDALFSRPLPGRLGGGRRRSRSSPQRWVARVTARLGTRASVHEPSGAVVIGQPFGPVQLQIALAPAPAGDGGTVIWWATGLTTRRRRPPTS